MTLILLFNQLPKQILFNKQLAALFSQYFY